MKYTLHENLSKSCGTISNLHGFLHRNNDSEFPTKWSGYWAPPYKYLDYYGIKINGIWLNQETVEATEYGDSFTFYHQLDSLSAVEKVRTPSSVPGFQLELKITNKTGAPKAVRTIMEPGIDIRHKSEDLGPQDYNTEYRGQRISASTNNRKMMISSENSFELERNEYVKEHFPGEKQRCLVPGELVFKNEIKENNTKEIQIDFTTSSGSFESIESKDQSLRHENVGRMFNYSIESLRNLIYDRNGKGLIAGHPWFQSYWARDSFWSLLGLIDAGYFELSEKILENFIDKKFCSRISLEKGCSDEFQRADTFPLFVIATKNLQRHTEIGENLEEGVKTAMDSLELENKIVQHKPRATWMDTIDRAPAVEIQSLWLEAAKLTNHAKEEKLRKGLIKFQDNDYMKDYKGENSPQTINPAVPLMFGHIEKENAEKYLEKINGEFSSQYGARTRSLTDPGYNSEGYHTGSVWGLTTGWAAAANFNYGNFTQGMNMLEKLTPFLDRNQLGALPEVVDAEEGNLIGSPEQAWSAGLAVHVVDSYLLGIKPREEAVEIDPAGPINAERKGKRVKGEIIDLKIKDGKPEILNEPGIEIKLSNQ